MSSEQLKCFNKGLDCVYIGFYSSPTKKQKSINNPSGILNLLFIKYFLLLYEQFIFF